MNSVILFCIVFVFSRGGIRLEQTVIFLRNVMIFLKVLVGMRKIATLTMEKTVRGGTKGWVVFGNIYWEMHYKDHLGSNIRVGYCILVLD